MHEKGVNLLNKRDHRVQMKKILSDLDDSKKIQYDRSIHANLINHEKWKQSQTIAVTISMVLEINTYPVIEQAWKEDKTVVVPKCQPESKTMTFYRLEDISQLEKSFYGLKEPNPSISQAINPSSIEWMIVPGLIFDGNGFRIGHGGGYYDRFLAKNSLSTVSLSYLEQLVTTVPHDNYDVPVDVIVTPEKVIQAKLVRENDRK